MSQKEIQESLELLEKDWDVDPILHDFVLGKYTDVTDFSLIVKNVVFHIPYLPKNTFYGNVIGLIVTIVVIGKVVYRSHLMI